MKQKNMGLLSPAIRVSCTLFTTALLLLVTCAKAQVLVGASFADNVVAAGIDAHNVNCDMVYNWGGGHLRAVAYDDFNTNTGFVKLDDYSGGSLTIPIPNGLFPDVVLGDYMGNPGNDYVLAVIYGASVTWMRTYRITGTGSGTLNAIPTSFQQISTSGSATSRFPHIDLYPDLSNPINGWPSLHRFVITWSEDFGSGMDVYTRGGDLMTPLGLTPLVAITAGGSGMMSDIAAMYDNGTNIAYAYIPYFNTSTNALDIATLDIGASTFTTASGIDNPLQSMPRVDAVQLNYAGSGVERYQVAYPKYNGSTFRIRSYNDLTLITDLTTAAGLGSIDNIQPAVGVGPGPIYGTPDYGNDNYTVAWRVPNMSHYIAQSIDVTTGSVNTSFPNYYVTNQGAMTVSGPIYFSPVAVSTSTNVGARLLTAWAGNGRVWYKYNSNTTGYKTTGVTDIPANEQYALYPNPATTELHIDGAKKGSYTISDMTGRTLMQGALGSSDNTIDIHALASGFYVAAITEGEVITLIKFTKQ